MPNLVKQPKTEQEQQQEQLSQWWTIHAKMLAENMKRGGVRSFRIELNERGNYEFEVIPMSEGEGH